MKKSKTLMRLDIQRRLERCSNLPTLPWVALKILELSQLEELDLGEIASVIGKDPALAAKLIRTANSPLFAVRGEVRSIVNAVSLLGVNAVRTLVLSFSLLDGKRANEHTGLKDYWRRSLLAAVAGREICAGGMANRDEAFLCCLLQDIGMLAFSRSLGEEYARVLAAAGADHDRLVELEREAFGSDHADTGAWLLERWKIPRLLAAVVRASHGAAHSSTEAGWKSAEQMARIVRLAGRFADLWTGPREQAPERLVKEVQEVWPPGSIHIEGIQAALLEQAPQIAALFDVHLDSVEMAQILEQAQEAMLAQSVKATKEVQEMQAALARLESRTAALLAEAHTDPLTGLANRGYTDSYFRQVFLAAMESKRLIGVIYVDIDRFKEINDSYGHSAGDSVLRSIALCISGGVRGGDFVGRYGGDEFIIILRADDPAEVEAVAERVRRTIEDTPHPLGRDRTARLTASLGWSMLDLNRHQSPQDLLDEADQALYGSKRSGRNSVTGALGAVTEAR